MMRESEAALPEQGFEDLYARYRLHILGYCRRRLDSADAADACSETFLTAWRRREELPPAAEALPYLYGIASRVVKNHRRSLRRRLRLDSKLLGLGGGPQEDPSTILVRREKDLQVQAAVLRLRPRDREIVMLYAWEDLPRETIAQMVGMSKTAVDQRIHRAYQRLAKVLEQSRVAPSNSAPPVLDKGNGS